MGSELTDLLARVEAAEGAERELDADLFWRFCERDSGICFHNAATGMPWRLDHSKAIPEGMGRAGVRAMAPKYSESLDAALALTERVLPGWRWMVRRVYPEDDGCSLHVAYVAAEDDGSPLTVTAPTHALAVVSALLRALITKAETEGEG